MSRHTSCHHELLPGEIWIGNTKGIVIPEHYRSLKTMRLGNQAYDIKGNPLPADYYRPLIIRKSEESYLEDIQNKRIIAISR